MISICIPTYEQKGQGARYLRDLLHSITQQVTGVLEFEVLISDNAADGTIREMVQQYEDRLPIRYIVNPVRGASENINNAIEAASCDNIKLMMQDDIFITTGALLQFADLLDRYGWVISNSIKIDANGIRKGQGRARYDPTNFDHNTVGMPSVIAFRRTALRFDPRIKTFCDLYFYYGLFKQYGAPAVIQDYAIGQRYHDASLSRNQPASHAADKAFLVDQGLIPRQVVKPLIQRPSRLRHRFRP